MQLCTAHALFTNPSAALEAVNKLHAHVFKGSLLSATLKKRLDGLAKAPKAKKAAASKETAKPAAPSRASRLIVRNLPFDVTEQDLRAVFLPYGPIYSVDIPLKDEEEGGKPRAKGFAFVWMLSRKDAERAMEEANGTRVQAGMAARLVTDKQKKKKQRREEERAEKAAKGEGEEAEDEEEAGTETRGRERVIAVDWALSKDKWQAEKAKLEQEDADADVKMEADEEGSEDGADNDASESEDGRIGVHEEDDEDAEGDDSSAEDGLSDSEEDDAQEQDQAKPALPPPETGTTLFVRNVPFEATEDELRTLWVSFSPTMSPTYTPQVPCLWASSLCSHHY